MTGSRDEALVSDRTYTPGRSALRPTRPKKSRRLTPPTPLMLSLPAGRHEGAGPRSVSSTFCGRGNVNRLLTWTRPGVRVVPARMAGGATPVLGPEANWAERGSDVDAPLEPESGADGELRGAITAGADELSRPSIGRSGVGTGDVGTGTDGAGTDGTGTVGAGRGSGTVGIGGRLGVLTTTVVTAVGTTTADTVLVAPTACATTTPRAARAIAARVVRPRIILQHPHTRRLNGRTSRADTAGRRASSAETNTIPNVPRTRPADVLFWSLAAIALLFVLAFLLVLFGGVAIEPTTETKDAAQTTETGAPGKTQALRPVEVARTRPQTTVQAGAPAQKPAEATVVLTAARGDSWFQAREDSAEGRVLDERILSEGESISLKGRRVWLALGAAGNLDVTVNGKAQRITAGTTSVVLGGQDPAGS